MSLDRLKNLELRVPHLLGLELPTLSHAQLDAVEEVHQAIVRAVTESRIQLEAGREHMLVEEAVRRGTSTWTLCLGSQTGRRTGT